MSEVFGKMGVKNDEEMGAKVVEAAKAFQEAAGLYHYLANTMLPPLEQELPDQLNL